MGSGYTLVGDANPFINILDHYVAGDLRANENVALTSIHTIWARNHNFHVEKLTAAGFDGSAEELFQAAKIINEAEYQRVVFDEFADKLLGGLKGSGSHGHDDYNPAVDARISHEFAAAAYRFGHSLIGQTLTIMDENGQPMQVPLTDAFLNPTNDAEAFTTPLAELQAHGYFPQPGYEQYGVSPILQGISGQQAEAADFNIVDAVRDDLVRIRADLFAFNVARGWDVGLGTLNQIRTDLMKSTSPYVMEAIELSGEDLSAYTSWEDFQQRNGLSVAVLEQFKVAYPDLVLDTPDALAAFVAANPDIELTGAGNNVVKGIDRVDVWVGGLAEEHINGGMLGSTFWVIIHEQLDRLQEGDRFYYTDRVGDFDFYEQIESQSFSDIVARNTGLVGLPEDIFSASDSTGTDSSNQGQDDQQDGSQAQDDPGTTDTGSTDTTENTDQSGGGTTNPGVTDAGAPEPLTLIGDDADNTLVGAGAGDILSGNGDNDTLLGGDGDNTMSGGEGNDQIVSGSGNDIALGGGGNDFILTGAGSDVIVAGDGDDHVMAGADDDLISGGGGRDVVDAGSGNDTVFAEFNDGNDVYQGGEGLDTYDFSAITDDVTVDLGNGSSGHASSVQSGSDTLIGFENVIGGAGDDTIIAGQSANVLTGGIGGDAFVFGSVAAANGDHITDFGVGDKIDLSGIAAQYNFGGDGNFTLLADGATFTQAGQVILKSDGSDLLIEGNVDLDGDAEFTIRISGKTDLDPSSFNGVS
ncbi:MAG TPA: peroxidase family protein, partial [Hyphomicrobiaceae bacterium]|nr:peroxidase family protein [Hyphomicrobiaceae bacterium]